MRRIQAASHWMSLIWDGNVQLMFKYDLSIMRFLFTETLTIVSRSPNVQNQEMKEQAVRVPESTST